MRTIAILIALVTLAGCEAADTQADTHEEYLKKLQSQYAECRYPTYNQIIECHKAHALEKCNG